MVSLGAGIYEELLFRVLLVTGLAAAARTLLGWTPFARRDHRDAARRRHLLGLSLYRSVRRPLAGLFVRVPHDPPGVSSQACTCFAGFGITAWTHASTTCRLPCVS